MPDAVAVAVCKAVTEQIEGGTFSQTFVLERSYADWHLELQEADVLRVDVCLVTTKQDPDLAARGSKLSYVISLDIAIRQKFGRNLQDEETQRIPPERVDELMLLVQEIHELFTPTRLTGFDAAIWQDTKILVAPLHSHLLNLRQFTGIIRTTWRVDRSLT